MATFTLTSGTDTFTGTSSTDYAYVETPGTVQSTDKILGGAGNDVIGLGSALFTGTLDLSAAATDGVSGFVSFETLHFYNILGQTITVVFNSAQFGTGKISDSLAVEGNTGKHVININMATGASAFSAAGWTFSSWTDGTDQFNIFGSAGNNTIGGSIRADTIDGADGNDSLSGGLHDDSVLGGNGNDTIVGVDGDGDDTYNGGAGVDVLDMSAATANLTVTETSVSGIGSDVISGFEVFRLGLGADSFTGGAQNDHVFGGAGADTIRGGDGSDTIDGGTGNDSLNGGLANDFIAGKAGADSIDGGDGNDVIYIGIDGSNDTVIGGLGTDTIDFRDGTAGVTVAFTAPGTGTAKNGTETDQFSGMEAYVLSAFNDVFVGSTGNDTVTPLGGNDNLNGGDGNDTFLLGTNEGTDTIVGGAGTDTVKARTASTYVTIPNVTGVEVFDGTGYANFRLIGTAGNDLLDFTGLTLINVERIDPGAGNDTVIGSAGSDVIVDSAGNDSMMGGDGNDRFVVDNFTSLGDVFNGGNGTDTIKARTASTTVNAANVTGVEVFDGTGFANFRLVGSAGNDVLNFTGITLTNVERIDGGAGNDTIIGSSGNDFIADSAGTDSLSGGDGNDTFLQSYTDLNDTIVGGNGTDTIKARTASTFINMANVSGVEVFDGTGQADFRLLGGSGNDLLDFTGLTLINVERIDGGAGNDTIIGSSGNDVIADSAGQDSLSGGAGNDTFLINYLTGAGDVINGGAGTDTLKLTSNSIIPGTVLNSIEAVNLNGFSLDVRDSNANDTIDFSAIAVNGAFAISAGAGNDRLIGNSGSQTITGGAGADVMTGGGGNDVFRYNSWSQSTVSAPDHITDFSAGDLIKVNEMDANPVLAGTQSWSFIGNSAFSANTPGQLRAYLDGSGNTVIEGNINNDTVADFKLILDGYTGTIGAGDFIL